MFDLLKRHEVHVLLRAGCTQAKVARLTGMSVRTIRRIASEPPFTSRERGSFNVRHRRAAGRPSTVQGFRDVVVDLLAKAPHLEAAEILRRARLGGYAGGASTFYPLVASVRKEMSLAAQPAAVAEHAFGGVDVRFMDRTKRRLRFFVTRLLDLHRVRVSIVLRKDLETIIRTLVDHYHAIGGVPLLAVFDRPDPMALEWERDGTVTQWNPVFADAALQLGFAVEIRGARHSSLVNWVKASFFRDSSFEDEVDLATRLTAWHREVGARDLPRAAAGSRRRYSLGLRPPRAEAKDFALHVPVYVGPDGGVWYEGNFYAMPPEAKNRPATLFLYPDRVHVAAGPHRADHPRLIGINEGPPARPPETR